MDKQMAKLVLLKHAEVFAEGLVKDLYDPAFDSAKDGLKKAIPGQADDALIELILGTLKPIMKQELLAQVEKLSAE